MAAQHLFNAFTASTIAHTRPSKMACTPIQLHVACHEPNNNTEYGDYLKGKLIKDLNDVLLLGPNTTWDEFQVRLNEAVVQISQSVPIRHADAAIASWGSQPGQRFFGSILVEWNGKWVDIYRGNWEAVKWMLVENHHVSIEATYLVVADASGKVQEAVGMADEGVRAPGRGSDAPPAYTESNEDRNLKKWRGRLSSLSKLLEDHS